MSEKHRRKETEVHVHEDGSVHSHEEAHGHEHGHSHEHGHVHTNKKAILHRLAKAGGHLESVMRMIDADRDCAEVLVQLAAVRSAINNAGKVLLQDHITECVTEAVKNNDEQKIADLNKAIERFMK